MDDALRHALAGHQTFDVTTTGRRSGQPRRIEIWYFVLDEVLYLTGTPGPRDWLANVRAQPAVTIHTTAAERLDADAVASVVDDVDERRRVMTAIRQAEPWYVEQGHSIDEWIAAAPLVRLDVTGASRPSPPAPSSHAQ